MKQPDEKMTKDEFAKYWIDNANEGKRILSSNDLYTERDGIVYLRGQAVLLVEDCSCGKKNCMGFIMKQII